MRDLDSRIHYQVKEWVDYAEGDIEFAKVGLKLKTQQSYRIVAYHAQQSAEKFLKAYLVFKKVNFPYTHDISELLNLCEKTANWANELQDAKILSSYASTLRYPGVGLKATKEEAIRAIEIAEHVREVVKKALIAEGMELE
jgi:HEPN domain-containing protein